MHAFKMFQFSATVFLFFFCDKDYNFRNKNDCRCQKQLISFRIIKKHDRLKRNMTFDRQRKLLYFIIVG